MAINVHHHYIAVVQTNRGAFTIQLLPRVAPLAVNNFVFLAHHRYYNGNLFFRILKTFVVQTGDPAGTGFGGPGYLFRDERVTLKYTPGTVAMANSGPNTNGSQFFIVTGPDGKTLKPAYTIFGKVTKGMNVVNKIASTPVAPNPGNPSEISDPLTKVFMKTVTIHESR